MPSFLIVTGSYGTVILNLTTSLQQSQPMEAPRDCLKICPYSLSQNLYLLVVFLNVFNIYFPILHINLESQTKFLFYIWLGFQGIMYYSFLLAF